VLRDPWQPAGDPNISLASILDGFYVLCFLRFLSLLIRCT
jgi:hypothetical protein